MNVTAILSVSLILFSVIDIIGSLPIIISMKKEGVKINAATATGSAAVIMLAFLFFGAAFLGLFGIDVSSFALAGALIIFFIGLEMILGIRFFRDHHEDSASGSIVPIAFPIIAGAGGMTTLVALPSEFEVKYILISIFINMVIVFVVLKLTKRIERLLGKGGIVVLEKVFGIILLAIAVKLFSSNIHELFESLEQSPK